MHELLSPAEMSRADALAPGLGMPGAALMDRAGRAVADAAARRPLTTPMLVLCGTGNNGGDGFVAARVLMQRGYRVRLALAGRREALKGDAAAAAALWTGPVEDAYALDWPKEGLVIDALLGAGLDRDLTGPMRALVEAVGSSGLPVLAVDLPSGIDGATGAVRGAAIEAQECVTFFRRKPGHLLLPGRAHCGQVRLADIGMPEQVLAMIAPRTFENDPALWRSALPVPTQAGHKFDRGHLLVVSGGLTATGAPRLAARAALRIGAGLVTVGAPADALGVHAARLEAVMLRLSEGAEGLARLLEDRRRNAIVIGPALDPDEETRRMVETALAAPIGVVLDAGGLSAFAGDAGRLHRALADRQGATIVTPHEGEFARAFPAVSGGSKLDRAREAAAKAGIVVVFKGADTVIAAPDGRAAINANAPPTLATAGSGDVLAGLAGGLLAQGMPAFEAACAAVHVHGAAAALFGPGLIAEDLPDLMPRVLATL